MKKTVALFQKLKLLSEGGKVASSQMRGEEVREMLADGVLQKQAHGRHVCYLAPDAEAFLAYLQNRWGITDLTKSLQLLQDKEGASRAQFTQTTGDSKFIHQRTMTGFLVNSYTDIPATLHGRPVVIHPAEGSFTYIYDYTAFSVPEDVVIIGVENAENFRRIASQRNLFQAYNRPLFVSRYPQNGDLLRWLLSVPNHYVHFGDFDLAGIHIFLTEFFQHLGPSRSEFFIPDDIYQRLPSGSYERYKVQYNKFGSMTVADSRLLPLFDAINREHKGYDQEGYINEREDPPPAPPYGGRGANIGG